VKRKEVLSVSEKKIRKRKGLKRLRENTAGKIVGKRGTKAMKKKQRTLKQPEETRTPKLTRPPKTRRNPSVPDHWNLPSIFESCGS
jgi:hypothetical protein